MINFLIKTYKKILEKENLQKQLEKVLLIEYHMENTKNLISLNISLFFLQNRSETSKFDLISIFRRDFYILLKNLVSF